MTERDNWSRTGSHLRSNDGGNEDAWGVGAAAATPSPNDGPDLILPPPGSYHQIVFIEGNVADARQLAAGVSAGTLAVILNPEEDGVTQIAAFLTRHDISGLAAIDIVAHGADGSVQVGTGTLSSDTLARYQVALATIGSALQQDGNIQLYGCDVAQDAAGVAFLNQLSAATGGANVSAASHLVGAASGGGSWDLNVNTGSIVAGGPFTAAAEAAYPAELPVSATSQLFMAFNVDDPSVQGSIDKITVSGSNTGTGLTSVSTSPLLSSVEGLLSIVVQDPQNRFYLANDPAASGFGSTSQILAGTLSTGALSAPSNLNFSNSSSISPWGIAASTNPNVLYMANFDAADNSKNGIWQINVNTGVAAPVAVSASIAGPDQLAIDQQNSLGFFTSSFDPVSQIAVGNLATGHVQVLLSNNTEQFYYGIAVNAGTVYFDSGFGGSSVDGIYSATYTVSGGTVALGAIHTLYSLTTNGSVTPTELAIDPANGIFYVGSAENASQGAWTAWEGSLGGSAVQPTLIKVVSAGTNTAIGPGTDGLALVSTPTITTGGTVAYVLGNAATALAAGATTFNQDGEGLAGATVKILNGTTNDILSGIVTGTSIVASYTAATETLALTGADTAAHYQAVLDSVAFRTTSPAGSRTINWTISDGVLNSATTTSSVTIANRGETVTAGATASFTGGGSPAILDSGLTVADAGSANLISATVAVGGFINGDTLTVGTLGGLVSNFTNGTLTLTGTASLATYQTALESVAYGFAAGGDPTDGGSNTSRTIGWTINDGVSTSTAAVSVLNVTHTPPAVTAGNSTVHQQNIAVVLDAAFTVSDPDSGGILTSATVAIGSGLLAGDTLGFTDQGGITHTYDPSTGTLTLTGTATVAAYQTALRSVTYSFSGDATDNGTDTTRSIAWTVADSDSTSAPAISSLATVCFCAGTMITTPDGERSVERLTAGDDVMIQTDAGLAPAKVKWVGHRQIDMIAHPSPALVAPVRISRGAFGEDLPRRELLLSPDHAVYVDGKLIPVKLLINGMTISRERGVRSVTYYHIELDNHALLLAEGLPAESYLDTGNRTFFANAGVVMKLHPDFCPASGQGQAAREAGSCKPFTTGGDQVEPVWRMLAARAEQLGWCVPDELETTNDPELAVLVDGRRLLPMRGAEGCYVFVLPRDTETVRLVSRAVSPSHARPWLDDPRQLSVMVSRLTLNRNGQIELIPLDDPALRDGWWDVEWHDQTALRRWTNGDACVPLPQGATGPLILEVEVAATVQYPNPISVARIAEVRRSAM